MPCHISEFILRMALVWDPFPICLCYTLWWISVNLPIVFLGPLVRLFLAPLHVVEVRIVFGARGLMSFW